MYTLFFDTDCDITPAIAKYYHAKLISMPYAVNGEEVFPYVDFETFDAHAFMDSLRKGALPTTSALPPAVYVNYFEPELEKGNDILYVHFSRAMSATFQNVDAAIKELLEKYPDRRIELIDTKGITLGIYAICKQLGELYLEGKTIEEMKTLSSEIVDKTAFYFFADNLKFFARSGRVSGFSAFMGGMIGIKPIINIDDAGKMVSVNKAIGRKAALEKIMNYVIELQDDIKNYPVVIAHGDAPHLVETFSKMLRDRFGYDLNIEVIDINPTAGSHCGPDTLGVTFHAKHR